MFSQGAAEQESNESAHKQRISENYFNILVISRESNWKGYFDLILLFASV